MAERNRPHIFIESRAGSEAFTPTSLGRAGLSPPSPSNRVGHSEQLRVSLESAAAAGHHARDAQQIRVEGTLSGIYVQFESLPDFELALTSLDLQIGAVHPELRSVVARVVEGKTIQMATVFVPDGWIGRFLERFDQYANEQTKKGNPKHRNLVERISGLRLATLEALWTDASEDFPSSSEPVWWEVWLRRRDGTDERLSSFIEQSGARLGRQRLVFEDRLVALVFATTEQLGAALEVLDDIAELRSPAEPFQFLADLEAAGQADFVADLAGRLSPPADGVPLTCVLDSGIAANHPLIAPALNATDAHSVEPSWGVEDRRGHGTTMAGTVLYPDLGTALVDPGAIDLITRLESVKILPDSGENSGDIYGALTAQAAALVEIQNPNGQRTFLLAVTAQPGSTPSDHHLGQPSAWSSTIDALAAGRQVASTDDGLVYLDKPADRGPRLFVVCTGNVRRPYDVEHLDRSDAEPAEDPAQAWNALAIGAYTTLDDLTRDDTFRDWRALAEAGQLSPFSRTSVGYNRQWRHTPDVVLEGGNAAVSPSGSDVDTPGALQVLTTRSLSLGGRLLTTVAGTSPATAAAGSLIAEIRSRYPALWPETVRALVVHSARWTTAMVPAAQTGRKHEHTNVVRRYGWGVPDVARALRSADDAVTLISQQTIRPYEDGTMREMHIHDLPWPTEVLQDLGDEAVEMRVALSYFIEPNPARRGWVRRFRYASHSLRFDVRRPTEDNAAFRKRLNKLALEEDERRPSSARDTGEWYLGPRERVRGSMHVDHWHGTAADLAARGSIAVYPVTGWWKEQPKRDRSELGVRYSLVVSIETPEVAADIWTPIAIQAAVPIEIQA